MDFQELETIWQKIFEMEWESVCHKSKAIAAVIVDETGNIISVGRNKIGETEIKRRYEFYCELKDVDSEE